MQVKIFTNNMRGKKILDMALLVSHRRCGSMLFIAVLCLVLNILSGVSALSLSIPRNTHNTICAQVGSSPTNSNKLFGIPPTQHYLSQRMSAATNNDNISSNKSPNQWAVVRLSKLSQQLLNLRKSIFKAATTLSLVLFGFNKGIITPPSAHAAWGSKSSNVVVVEAPPVVVVKKASLVRKMTKLLVAAGAVSVGLSVVPNTVGSSSSTIDGDEDDDRVVPKDEPSPLPLPTQNLELMSKPKPTSKTLYPPPKQSNTNNTKKDQSLVKDLDSKIEMLRIREENAKASAEEKRLVDLERATEARKQEQAEIDARIQAEAEKVKDAQRQKAMLAEKQREEELSKLESGKKFQQIKEQVSDDGGMVLEDVTAMIKQLPKKEISTTAPAVIRMGSSMGPAKSKEEDIELTTQVILEYVKSKEGEEAGVVDDE